MHTILRWESAGGDGLSYREPAARRHWARIEERKTGSMDVLVPLFAFVPIGMVIFVSITKNLPAEERSWLLSLLVAAFLLRTAAATMFATFPELRLFHEDADGTEVYAMLLASVWRGEAPPLSTPPVNFGFINLAAGVYYVFGRYRANASMFNALLGSLLVFLVYRLADRLFHNLVARRAAVLVALMPSMVLWGSIALKDVPVTFAIVLSLSSCIELKRRVTLGTLGGTFLPLLAIQPMRFYIVYFVVFAIVTSLVLDRGLRHLSGVYRQIFLVAAFGGLFALLGLTDRAETDASQYLSLDYISQYRRGMASTARSGFDADVDISQPTAALAYLPIGVAHLLLAPFPWQMTSLRALIAAPETIFWWTLFPATLKGIAFSFRNRFADTSPLIVFSATLTSVYALMHGNVGSAFRQRAQILIFLFIFSGLGTYLAKARQAGIDPRQLLRKNDGT